MKRLLEITLVSTSENTFDVEIYEPETGDFISIPCHDNGDSVDAENEKITDEIRSWVDFMRESSEGQEEQKEK